MVMAIFLVITISCSSNEEELENTTNLIGSKWVNLDTTTGIDFYTFISATEYIYTEDLGPSKGTYTFNISNGKGEFLEDGETYVFKINGDLLSFNDKDDLYKRE